MGEVAPLVKVVVDVRGERGPAVVNEGDSGSACGCNIRKDAVVVRTLTSALAVVVVVVVVLINLIVVV